jgi:hypothetical protein
MIWRKDPKEVEMGLDMFLEGRKWRWSNFREPEQNPMEDGFQVKETVLELGYWRKHPNLHGYIVRTFAGGVDECQSIQLTSEAIDRIIDAVEKNKLPETSGFFFGHSDGPGDKFYDGQKSRDLEILNAAKQWLNTEEPEVLRSITYQASW